MQMYYSDYDAYNSEWMSIFLQGKGDGMERKKQ